MNGSRLRCFQFHLVSVSSCPEYDDQTDVRAEGRVGHRLQTLLPRTCIVAAVAIMTDTPTITRYKAVISLQRDSASLPPREPLTRGKYQDYAIVPTM